MSTIREVILPDGSTFNVSNWGDYPMWSEARTTSNTTVAHNWATNYTAYFSYETVEQGTFRPAAVIPPPPPNLTESAHGLYYVDEDLELCRVYGDSYIEQVERWPAFLAWADTPRNRELGLYVPTAEDSEEPMPF